MRNRFRIDHHAVTPVAWNDWLNQEPQTKNSRSSHPLYLLHTNYGFYFLDCVINDGKITRNESPKIHHLYCNEGRVGVCGRDFSYNYHMQKHYNFLRILKCLTYKLWKKGDQECFPGVPLLWFKCNEIPKLLKQFLFSICKLRFNKFQWLKIKPIIL